MRFAQVLSAGLLHLPVASCQTVAGPELANATLPANNSAAALISQALRTLEKINLARFESPVFNKYEFKLQEEDAAGSSKLAQPLRYLPDEKHAVRRSNITSDGTQNVTSYTIPDELRQAARDLAESTAQVPSGDHEQIAREMREKYSSGMTNDTEVPQSLDAPEGRLSVFADDAAGVGKRDTGYWLIDDQSFPGQSPFAPAGYRVWRNVKDYGAKGDGKADDTEAINRAIANGGRCGPDCGSSTIYPAVVYFPSGTYLVSSPIIQYYNTQLLGDPKNVPTILAAQSFVGLGVITSNVYVGDDIGWYLNTNNFLRSVKNFKMDIRLTERRAYICAIHWQVAQGTSLENIEFYMLYNSDYPDNTQQGIYMENGSGGFLSELVFVGGNFGAYFGNQQFTTSHLVFARSNTALQVHWDWAWTMQDFIIESCTRGLVITGGAGGSHSTGQGVGSLLLTDTIIANTPAGIVTSLQADSSTSFLMQNVGFFNVTAAVKDTVKNRDLLAGGQEVHVPSWGFGRVTDAKGTSRFVDADYIPAMNRSEELLGSAYDKMQRNLFTRRRPKYYDVPRNKIMNVRQLGAKGDGKTDDTYVLNAILQGAANTSSVVYFPFGVYLVRDTVKFPIGSRVIGQAWSQIMATGAKFENEAEPRAVVQVGEPGERGIIEIQDMMVTVSGATAGAVLMEWNAQESSKGSVGMWDSHFRVGGAIGSKLQKAQCPKLTGAVNAQCKAASLLLHLKPESTAYLENIDIYVGRGILIESQRAWLWGTASEHAVFYQYQLSGAKNILMGMIQTESPYYQPSPMAPQPFKAGTFPNDPTFSDCSPTDLRCASSWAVRLIDSSSIYMLGSGLYSWFSQYSQDCLKTEDCQARAIDIQNSHDIWIYNLCTKAIVEMVSPLGAVPTYAKDNINGFLSSILAWLQGSKEVSGRYKFPGFEVYTADGLQNVPLPDLCKSALTSKILCVDLVSSFAEPQYRGSLSSAKLMDAVCDEGCGLSLKSWFDNVNDNCNGYNISSQIPTLLGGRMWAGVNETCSKDPKSDRYCNDIIRDFTLVSDVQSMPQNELCSDCYAGRLRMMQRSSYSIYGEMYKDSLDFVVKKCGIKSDTSIPPSVAPPAEIPRSDLCVSQQWYEVPDNGQSCDSIALSKNVSSAALYGTNPTIANCSAIQPGLKICLPLSCAHVYKVQPDDTCSSIEANYILGELPGSLRHYNSWLYFDCSNLHTAASALGRVVCLAPQNGQFNSTVGSPVAPKQADGYANTVIPPPDSGVVAKNTTRRCGRWHVADKDDDCVSICLKNKIDISLFLKVNPSLSTQDCTATLVRSYAYCAGPVHDWDAQIQPPTPSIDRPNDGPEYWTSYGGEFRIVKREITGKYSEGGRAIHQIPFADFTLDVYTRVERGGNSGVVFRDQATVRGDTSFRGYYFGISTDGYAVLGYENNGWRDLAKVPATIKDSSKGIHRLGVVARGDLISVYLDDAAMKNPIMQVRDGTYKDGRVGVRVYKTSAAWADVTVRYV
ncbi:hypothetical protein LMH87_001367 [Akanthomyces muscarius]|uniref:LysM domain-containing protein n=1 Tax=Akanthomyces muscarius TaxID=2231603 RepID=A0A9W8UPN1_AKAMU|nr:hypothetical protein LMH87_001367 [Akanthomyces muscarius]KAJ4156154.1 hypothetical protein LMH87_001367 [Akanthomyces muscarius]